MPPINNQDQKGPYLAQDLTHGIEQLFRRPFRGVEIRVVTSLLAKSSFSIKAKHDLTCKSGKKLRLDMH